MNLIRKSNSAKFEFWLILQQEFSLIAIRMANIERVVLPESNNSVAMPLQGMLRIISPSK